MGANSNSEAEAEAGGYLILAIRKAVADAEMHQPELMPTLRPLANEVIRNLQLYIAWGREPN